VGETEFCVRRRGAFHLEIVAAIPYRTVFLTALATTGAPQHLRQNCSLALSDNYTGAPHSRSKQPVLSHTANTPKYQSLR
jgi:hypothetical protein